MPKDWLAGADFAEAAINPMSEADRTQFIHKWHAAVRDQLRRDKRLSEGEDPDALVQGLTQKLRDNPPIARLATNPLLCGMICALHRQRQRALPQTQVELCEDLCRMLLDRREKEVGLDTGRLSPMYARRDYEQKRAVVQELAHYMVRNGQSADNVQVEADWSLLGMWAMALHAQWKLAQAGIPVRRISIAGVLRAYRNAMSEYKSRPDSGEDLWSLLSDALIDEYVRTSKASRDYPCKKYEPPPGAPEIVLATREQKTLAKKIKRELALGLTA